MLFSGQPLPNPRVLAYLGDGVYELWVREQGLKQGISELDVLHRWVTRRVNAVFQAGLIQWLTVISPNETHLALTEEEQNWIRRGRNSPLTTSKRHQQQQHRSASSLETLIGALHLTNPDRKESLFNQILAYPPFLAETVTTMEGDADGG